MQSRVGVFREIPGGDELPRILHGEVAPQSPGNTNVVLSVELFKGRANPLGEGGLLHTVGRWRQRLHHGLDDVVGLVGNERYASSFEEELVVVVNKVGAENFLKCQRAAIGTGEVELGNENVFGMPRKAIVDRIVDLAYGAAEGVRDGVQARR